MQDRTATVTEFLSAGRHEFAPSTIVSLEMTIFMAITTKAPDKRHRKGLKIAMKYSYEYECNGQCYLLWVLRNSKKNDYGASVASILLVRDVDVGLDDDWGSGQWMRRTNQGSRILPRRIFNCYSDSAARMD